MAIYRHCSVEADAELSASSTYDESSDSSDSSDSDSDTEATCFTKITTGGRNIHIRSGGSYDRVITTSLHNICIGNGASSVVDGTGQKQHIRSPSKKPKVETLTESTEQPSNTDMNRVCNNIGRHWKHMADALSLSRGDIESIEIDFHVEGAYEMAWQSLRKWRMRRGAKATLTDLASALDSIGCRDIALDLSER